MARLVFTDPRFAGAAYSCMGEKTTVGRAPDNTLIIEDPSVSAHHCEILVHGTEVIVRDLGSRNGTLVNGARLTNQQAPVVHGARLQLGQVQARVEIAPMELPGGDTEITALYSHRRVLRDGGRGQAGPAAPGSVILQPPGRAGTDGSLPA